MTFLPLISQLGCFVLENFLTTEECAQLKTEMMESHMVPATTVSRDSTVAIDEISRKTKHVDVSQKTLDRFRSKILVLKPKLESYFEMQLENCQVPQFLIYNTGDYFKPHKDVSKKEEVNSRVGSRRISAVVFINGQSREPAEHSFGGGSLNLYGLVDKPGWEDKGFPIEGQTALLVAFRSDVTHEVTEVTHGKRCTVVNWFY